MNSIKLFKVYNNCNIITINKDIDLLFSYNSLIGIHYNGYLIFNEYYINYSKTTSKHINLIKEHYYIYNNVITVTNKCFETIINCNYNIDYLKKLINLDISSYICLRTVEHLQTKLLNKDVDLNTFKETFKQFKTELNRNGINFLKVINYNVEQLKTVEHIKITYKINNISFELIKTYNKGFKKLINVKLQHLNVEHIESVELYI